MIKWFSEVVHGVKILRNTGLCISGQYNLLWLDLFTVCLNCTSWNDQTKLNETTLYVNIFFEPVKLLFALFTFYKITAVPKVSVAFMETQGQHYSIALVIFMHRTGAWLTMTNKILFFVYFLFSVAYFYSRHSIWRFVPGFTFHSSRRGCLLISLWGGRSRKWKRNLTNSH